MFLTNNKVELICNLVPGAIVNVSSVNGVMPVSFNIDLFANTGARA